MKTIFLALTTTLLLGSTQAGIAYSAISATGELSENEKKLNIPAVKSELSIQIPHKLHGNQPHVLAQYGLTVDRGSMTRFVYYVDKTLCDHDAFHHDNIYPTAFNDTWVRPFFIFATDEGHCSPVRMSRLSQEFGASALILSESSCRCDDENCTATFGKEDCLDGDVPLVDDGSALDVSIPTAIVRKSSTIVDLQKYLMDDQPAMMELTYGLPMELSDLPEGAETTVFKPHYHLWTTAHDPLTKAKTYEHLKALAVAFGDTVHFKPRFYIMNGKTFGCHNGDAEEDPCHHLCTNNGRYCTSHANHVNGMEIIKETVRRLCIFENYPDFKAGHKRGEKINTAFYDYSIYHLDHCSDPIKYNDTKCIESAYQAAKISKAEIEMCIHESGDTDKDDHNVLLDEMLEKQEHSNVVQVPSAFVKYGLDVRTTWTKDLFDEICGKFWHASMHSPYVTDDIKVIVPEICNICGACSNVMGCVEAGQCVPWNHKNNGSSNGSRRGSGRGWFFTFLVFASLIGGAGYYYYKQREALGDAGAGLLDGYMHMTSS